MTASRFAADDVHDGVAFDFPTACSAMYNDIEFRLAFSYLYFKYVEKCCYSKMLLYLVKMDIT